MGEYHTHGDYSLKANKDGIGVRTTKKHDYYDSDNFSPDDKDGADTSSGTYPGYRMYLGTPSGVFRVYDTSLPEKQRDHKL